MDRPVVYRDVSPATRRAVRNEYVRLQNGLCWYCGNSLDGPPREDVRGKGVNKKLFPPSMFDYPVHLHHDHETGYTIGAVHCYCNAFMWQYEGK